MKTLAKHAHTEGLILFAGAGISMLPPTSLPNWFDLNQMTLAALAERIGEYIQNPGRARSLLTGLVRRRDQTDCFAPDYQAQLMVEECGSEYFRVLQALDTDTRNPCHDAVAHLAKNGWLKAVLTTNFDRLCELALEAEKVPYRTYIDQSDFEELKRIYEEGADTEEVPVIKIHGSVEKLESMVDTLQQRIRGRGKDLLFILEKLQQAHHWLFIGFSGADFDYDPNYLSLKSGSAGGKGFTFLVRPGEKVRKSVQELLTAYGGRAQKIEGELPSFLFELLEALNLPQVEPAVDLSSNKVSMAVKGRIEDWAASLDIMQVLSIFSVLLSGADANIKSYELLRSVWRSYRKPEDTVKKKSYGRFCYRFGTRLLEHGVTPDENWEGAIRSTFVIGNDRPFRDDAFQFLGRAKKQFGIHEATAGLALALACQGNLPAAEAALSESFKYAADNKSLTVWSDSVYAASIIKYLQRNWPAALQIITRSHNLIRWDGDEPRRARYNAWLGAHLAWNHQYDAAEQFINEGLEISNALGLSAIKGDNLWAQAILETERKNGERSMELFDKAWRIFEKNVLRPRQVLVYLEASRAIRLKTPDSDFTEWAVDRYLKMQKAVDELLEDDVLAGFIPSFSLTNYYYFWNLCMDVRQQKLGKEQEIECLLNAKNYLSSAKRFGVIQQNNGVLKTVAVEEADLLAELQALGIHE